MSINTAFPAIRARHEALTLEALRGVFTDQQADVVVAGRSLVPEWDARLARIIYTRNRNTATDAALQVARALDGQYDPDVMDAWLTVNADLAAQSINASTRDSLASSEDRAAVFDALLSAGVARFAKSMVTTSVNFGAHDAAEAVGGATKTWTGGSSRHAHMNGQTVRLSENFSNGMAWPGDPDGGADENAQCECSLTIVS